MFNLPMKMDMLWVLLLKVTSGDMLCTRNNKFNIVFYDTVNFFEQYDQYNVSMENSLRWNHQTIDSVQYSFDIL